MPASTGKPRHRGRRRPLLLRRFGSAWIERGMTTAEYAIGTIAAASFAVLLIKLVSSDPVQQMLLEVLRSALSLADS